MDGNSETETLTPPQQTWSRPEWGIVAGLVALTAIVYAQVATHNWLNYDDPQFVYLNEGIRNGDLHWALTSTQLTWLPLTWISYMIDFRLWGLQAGGYLLFNAVLHALSVCFLFAALRRLTAATWPSAFVAALFAIHPAHVESVAWISERKDVLSTLFAILAIFFYARRKLALTAVMMALSLMAKQTYITLPFVLLLLDYWPLERLRRPRELVPLLIEKVPLFVLSVLGSIAAWAGQKGINAVTSTRLMSVGLRVSNAFVAYARYLAKMFLPVRLAVFYPIRPVPAALALTAAALMVLITAVAIVLRKRAPYIIVGWLWFLGTLVPVIGIVQIGGQALADRYTYFSYIGLSMAIVWAAMALPITPRALIRTGAVVLVIFTAMAWRQTSYWKNCDTLFSHTLAVTGDNAVAEYLLGQYLQFSDPERSLAHLQRAIDLGKGWADQGDDPKYDWFPSSHVAASSALLAEARTMPPGPARAEKLRAAIAHAKRALEINPRIATAPANIKLAERVLAADAGVPQQSQPQSAPQAQTPAVAVPPDVANQIAAILEQGTALSQSGRQADAVAQYRKAVALAPRLPVGHIYLALGLLQAQKRDEAVAHLRTAKALDSTQANDILTRALHMQPDPGNLDMFIGQFQQR